MGLRVTSDLTVSGQLLSEAELPVFEVINPGGAAPIVLVCEHASAVIPSSLDDLGLSETARNSHIAWDPGALEVAVALSRSLDAPLVAARISRLVYDCNRPPDTNASIPSQSEVFEVPGNRELNDTARRARVDEVYEPFRQTLAGVIADKKRSGPTPALITIHSFTPVYFGHARSVQLGILHSDNTALAEAMLSHAADVSDLNVQRNQPYGSEDGVLHTLELHGQKNGLPSVMIEIRNDLLNSADGVRAVSGVLSKLITQGLSAIAPHAVGETG